MSQAPSSAPLPARPELDQLKKQAKELRASGGHATLAAAQQAIARQYGFPSWSKLKTAVEQITLQRLIEEGDTSGVRSLVESSPALITLPFADGSQPLHVAAGENRPDIVEVLVKAGAPLPSKFGKTGHSALSWALTCWAYDAARKLVELGLEPDLFCAAGLGLIDRVQAFWPDGRLKRRPSLTGSSRYDAAGDRLPSPPTSDRDQVSDALYLACRCDQLDVARWLLDHGADPDWLGYCGATCLAWAEFAGNAQLTALLRQRGASDDLRDREFGATPRAFGVMVLAGWGFPQRLVARLAADRTLVSLTCARGTPLHVAAAAGKIATTKVLLYFGADATVRDADGRTPRDVALANGHAEIAALLAG